MKKQAPELRVPLSCLLVLISMGLTLGAAPVTIDYQPESQAVVVYQQAAFGVIASGTSPLTYQWRKDKLPLAGATNDQIVLTQVQFSDAGVYSVVVSNAENNVTSTDALLTVNLPSGGDVD